jgi:hypothetical protein
VGCPSEEVWPLLCVGVSSNHTPPPPTPSLFI